MEESIVGELKIRNDLRSERKRVFADFSRNPSNIRLALEIKALDDRISDLDMSLSKSSQRAILVTANSLSRKQDAGCLLLG